MTDRVREGNPAGSLRYLAVLFSGSPSRPVLEAVYAFEAELRRIVVGTSHEAAHARLQWWRGELDRLAAGRPSHPVAQSLLPLRERRNTDLALLHEMLVAADLDLARMTYLTWHELDAYLFRSAGALQTLLAATLADERELAVGEREFARRLGAAVRQTEMLFDLRRDVARGRLYAPTEALEAVGIEPQAFVTGAGGAARDAFLADWRERVRRELAELPNLLEGAALRTTQRHGLVLAALHARWLDRVPTPPGDSSHRTELGSLPRLWTAWRTAVRHS